MTATELAAWIIIGLFFVVVVVTVVAMAIGFIVWRYGPDFTPSGYDPPAVLPENWK